MSEEVEYVEALVGPDRSKVFYNRRTCEVIPAGSEEVAGRVIRNRDGTYTAVTLDGETMRTAKLEGALVFVIRNSRG